MKNSQTIAISIVVIALIAGGYFLYSDGYGESSATENQTPTHTNQVSIDDFAYNPSSISVDAGTTVTWTNKDSVTHTVTSTSESESFESGDISTDETFQHTFENVGTYDYKCTIHPSMTGTVIVE